MASLTLTSLLGLTHIIAPCKEAPNRSPKLEQFRERGLVLTKGPSTVYEREGGHTTRELV